LAVHDRDTNVFRSEIADCRRDVMNSVSASSMDSYERAYPSIVKLQMLTEVQEFFNSLLNNQQPSTVKQIWQARLKLNQGKSNGETEHT
jgi:hypothetical protein